MRHAYPERRDTPGIFKIGINLTKIIEICQRLTKCAERHIVSSELHRFLVFRSNTRCIEVEYGHGITLKTVAANEVRMLAGRRRVAEANNINSGWPVRWIPAGKNLQIIKRPTRSAAYHMVHEVMAEQSAGISEAFGVFPSGGVQQNASGLERLCGYHHRPGAKLLCLLRRTLDESDTLRLVAACVHIDVADDGVGDQRAISGLYRILYSREGAAEI